jgi:hypothetical protein
MALLKLTDKHFEDQLEAACEKALSYTPRPSFKNIKLILESGQLTQTEKKGGASDSSKYGFTRGADYYGKNDSLHDGGDA